MINIVQDGNVISFANTATNATLIASNSIVVIGDLIGVAANDIAVGESGSVALKGVVEPAPKATGTAWTKGQRINYSIVDSKFTPNTTSSYLWAGWAWEAAASDATTGVVKLKC